ncbi:thiamine pyrophosphokinase [Umbelopsis sp. PMI_123]|nr:thiamine pyrophosphokinase [Umbelopsis sp. PMI_123]
MRQWRPSDVLSPAKPLRSYALIILNQKLNRMDVFKKLWSGASYRFCADGGANRLYDAFVDDLELREKYLPHAIHGDLDSLRKDVRDYYQSKKVEISQDHDQNSTDFMKCISLLRKNEENNNKIGINTKYDIVAFPALGGRFDQTIASINQLYFLKDDTNRQTLLVSDENLTILLDKGKHRIECNRQIEGPTCGIMPLGGPIILTTHGLQWDLTDYPCHFGGMVSTSNLLASDVVEIETDKPVVWTVELKEG